MMVKREAIEYLKSSLKDGDTIYPNVQHVSQSGMTRDIKIISIKENMPLIYNYYVSKPLGYKIRNSVSKKIPYSLVMVEKEIESKSFTLRSNEGKNTSFDDIELLSNFFVSN